MTWESLRQQLPKNFSPQDVELVERAYYLAERAHSEQKRKSGEPYIIHPLAVASILADLRLDGPTVAAALLHDVAEDTDVHIPDLAEEFGAEVASLVDGVTKLVAMSELASLPDSRDPKIESLRKLFLAMYSDVRVVLIKLADRLHNMRTMAHMAPDKQRKISRETLDIYAPLASLLGMAQIRWELEDLAFRYLEPQIYADMKLKLNQRRAEREALLARITEQLQAELERHNIHATEITARPKHIYSIWRKMQKKGVPFDQIYDRQAVRILVPEVADCYGALGVVHTMWRPIPGEFDDYIANPKENQYQSLHTAVIGPEGQPIEVQIRTPEMHRIAEIGVAAHWRYKSQARHDEAYERKIAWLRSVIDWQTQERNDSGEFIDTVKEDLFRDRVYVFTPKGEVIDLPAGATPIDFAYQVHTEIGHRCRGARVANRLVGLDYQLKNGDQVEIVTAKRGGPSRDWLNPHLGYTKTSRAKTKIRQWFRQQNRDENIQAGREIVERELERLDAQTITYDELGRTFGVDKLDDFLEKVGCGDVTNVQIATKVLERDRVVEAPKTAAEELPRQEGPQKPAERVEGIAVQGAGNFLTTLSRCCNPMPPDNIVGYVTRGRGVSIHRSDCPNVLQLSGNDHDRLIQVDWGMTLPSTSRVKIRVQAYDRAGLLADIAQVIKEEKISLADASAVTARQDNLALITATLEVRNAEQLSRVLERIDRLPNVVSAKRQNG